MPAVKAAVTLAALLSVGTSSPYPDESTLLREIGRLRTDPAGYAAELRGIAAGYVGADYLEGDGSIHASREGATAVIEAASVLVHQPPLASLSSDPTLREAARDHVLAQGPAGEIGHASAAGVDPGERVKRRGGDIYVGEVIAYGQHSPVDVVRALVIDDGVATRGHRRLLLSPAYRFAGAWCGPHATWEMMCVIDLAATPGGRVNPPRR